MAALPRAGEGILCQSLLEEVHQALEKNGESYVRQCGCLVEKSSMVKKTGRVCSFHLDGWSPSQNMTYLYAKIILQWQMFSFKNKVNLYNRLEGGSFSRLVFCGFGGA